MAVLRHYCGRDYAGLAFVLLHGFLGSFTRRSFAFTQIFAQGFRKARFTSLGFSQLLAFRGLVFSHELYLINFMIEFQSRHKHSIYLNVF